MISKKILSKIKAISWTLRLPKYSLILVALLFSINLLQAQNDSLQHYLEIAASNNPKLKDDFLIYKAALEKLPQVGAIPDPQLDMGFFLKPMDIIDGSQVADFTLMQMFPWFGTRKAAQTEAKHMANQEFERFRESRDNLFLSIYEQWFILSELGQQKANLQEHTSLLEQLEQLAIRKFSTAGNMSETLRIQLEKMELENSIESIESKIKSEKAKFNALLNRPANSEVYYAKSLEIIPFEMDLTAARNLITEQNPSLALIEEEKEAFKAKAIADQKMSLPTWGVGLQYSMIKKRMGNVIPISPMNGMDMLMPMVSVSIPIYRNKYKAQQKESELLKQASEERYINTLNDLEAELVAVNHNLEDALRRVKLIEKQRNLAETTYQLLLNQFISGKSDLTEIIQVQRQLLDYELAKSAAIAEYNSQVASVQRIFSSFNIK